MNDDLRDDQEQPRITAEAPESLPRRIVGGPVLTPLGQYEAVAWEGVNTSGLKPMGDSVLILPDQPRERTTGGIYLSEQEVERMAYAAETGVIVEVGEGAWAWNADRTRKFEGERPSPGTRIWFERYAGALPHGIDGLIYRLVTDKQIGAVAIGLPETHEIVEANGRRFVQRKEGAEAKPAPTPKTKAKPAPLVALPAWPRYLKKNGNMMMAYDQADATAKAPHEIWWATRELAEMRAS